MVRKWWGWAVHTCSLSCREKTYPREVKPPKGDKSRVNLHSRLLSSKDAPSSTFSSGKPESDAWQLKLPWVYKAIYFKTWSGNFDYSQLFKYQISSRKENSKSCQEDCWYSLYCKLSKTRDFAVVSLNLCYLCLPDSTLQMPLKIWYLGQFKIYKQLYKTQKKDCKTHMSWWRAMIGMGYFYRWWGMIDGWEEASIGVREHCIVVCQKNKSANFFLGWGAKAGALSSLHFFLVAVQNAVFTQHSSSSVFSPCNQHAFPSFEPFSMNPYCNGCSGAQGQLSRKPL